MSRHHRLIVPEARNSVHQLKYEIANKSNAEPINEYSGSIGGAITRRLVEIGEEQLKESK